MAMLGGLLALVAMQPAQANHGATTLQVTPEISTAAVGTDPGDGVTLVARLSATTAGVRIAFELEGVPGDSDGANTNTADRTCITLTDGTCSITISSGTSGTGLVRAWIDHDLLDASAGGVREADLTEGRLSNANPYVPSTTPGNAADCRNNGTSSGVASDTPYEQCAPEGPASTATPGTTAEPDDTDVVQVGFSDSAARIDCVDSNTANGTDTEANPTGANEAYTCTVRDTGGNLVSGVPVDGENLNGANDLDDSAAQTGTPDYDTTDFDPPTTDTPFCRTSTSGACTGTVSAAEGDAGPANICLWIDTADNSTGEMRGDAAFNNTNREDGSHCDDEAAEDDDDTDIVSISWSDAPRAAAALDVTPETSEGTAGGSVTLTATVYDQFGDKFSGTTAVGAELFSQSPGDIDGNNFTSADRSCTTASADNCSLVFTASTSGVARVCSYVGAAPSTSTGNNTDGTCDGESVIDGTLNDQDVTQIVWKASSSSSTTTTSTTSPPPEEVSKTQGYTLVGGDGGIYNFGTSQFHGSTGSMKLNQPVIGLANKKGGTGYWLVARDGGIFTFGDADFFGSTGSMKLNAPILGMEATPSGKGYYLFAADGGIFTFGDAQFHGSTGDMKLNAPAVGLSINEKGDGYWLVAQDGGIFSFGKVPFHGSTGSMKLNQPVFDMAPTAGDKGYWLVAKDGGIFSFGDAENNFYGSAVGSANGTVIGMGTTPTFNGYWIADSAGGVFPFGDARALGDRRGQANNAPIVGFATVPK